MNPTAVIVAAPTLFRNGLLATFQEQWPRLALMLLTDTAHLTDLIAAHPFRLLVLDTALAGRELPNLLVRLKQARPTQPLLVLTESGALPGAAATELAPMAPTTSLTLSYQTPPRLLAAALRKWLETPTVLHAPLLTDTLPVEHAKDLGLTELTRALSTRELEVLRLAAADYCNHEIAQHLCISVRTVESHRRTLLQKTGTRSLVGLMTRAVREGWVSA